MGMHGCWSGCATQMRWVLSQRSDTGVSPLPDSRRPSRKSSVTVRLPQENDWPILREIVRQLHARTVFADLPLSETKLDGLERHARSPKPHECLIVAVAKGVPVGLAWFTAGEYLICDDALMTTVHLIAVDAEKCGPFLSARVFNKLVRGIVQWSRTRGSDHVLIHVTTGAAIKTTDRLLRAGGARCIGGGYAIYNNSDVHANR